MERMGCVEQRAGKKWIGTLHPAHIMRLPLFKQDAIDHLKKAHSIAGISIPLPEVEIVTSPLRIIEYSKLAASTGEFADDVETSQSYTTEEDDYIGGDWDMDMCGFSAARYHAIVVRPPLVHHWQDTWALPAVRQYEHNGEYEYYHLSKHAPQLNTRFDTM